MIGPNDILSLAYTPDLTEAGIAQASRQLSSLQFHGGQLQYDVFRRNLAATAARLALMRHLTAHGVEYAIEQQAPFSSPDRAALLMQGRRCLLQSFLISRPRQIREIAEDPTTALRASGLVPLDHFESEARRGSIFIFMLVVGKLGGAAADHDASGSLDAPQHWIHIMPAAWRRPRRWIPLGDIDLEAKPPAEMVLELAGEDGSRQFTTIRIPLSGKDALRVGSGVHSLSLARAVSGFPVRTRVTLRAQGNSHAITPAGWQDVWIDGQHILILGWLPWDRYRAAARLMPAGSTVFQFARTRVRNLAVDASKLLPFRELL